MRQVKSDTLFVDENRLEKLLHLLDVAACKNNQAAHLKLFYELAPEIKKPHHQLMTGF